MNDLQRIGVQRRTDKADVNHSFRGMSYLDVYESYFAPIRQQVKCVLELGVFRGASLMTWRDYFPNAQVWGIDIDPIANAPYGDRVKVVTGSQADLTAIAQVAAGQEFDIVVDDGSHLVDHLIASFGLIWPRVKPGGFYVMEDLGCTYLGNMAQWKDVWPGQKLNAPDTNYQNDRPKLNKFFTDLLEPLDGLHGEARFIHFWAMQCFIKKAETLK
jgi:cephalosporin hydroxylase